MKKILVTGANSYIGTSFDNHMKTFLGEYSVDIMDMIDGTWREKSFAGYDAVFHVVGIAHSDNGNVSKEEEKKYYEINTDLAIETAKKAKDDGVKQFVYMSSIIVYGDSNPIGKPKVITADTPVSPANYYGDSKVQAEKGILELADEGFKAAIVRSPMVYGKNSKGNYPTLAKMALKLPLFPYVKNQRSMIYVGNLCEFIRLLITNEDSGIFCPQNSVYTNTSEMVKQIALCHGKKRPMIKGFGWFLRILSHMTPIINKAFGNLSYDMELSEYKDNYRIVTFEESIKLTEG